MDCMGTYRDHRLERMKTIMDRIPVLRAKAVGLPATLALTAVIALAGGALAAEPFPDRPVTLIVPYAAGGSSDVLARLIGERMSKSLGQQIVIDNRAGAGSRLGIEIAAKSAPDGYTLLLADMPHTIIPAIQKGVHYDPVRDFTPIGLIGTASMVFFRQSGGEGRDDPGLCRARESRPGKDHHRFRRDWQRHPPHRGASSGQNRHQARARAVSRRRPGDERSRRWPCAVGLHHARNGELGSRPRSRARDRKRNAAGDAGEYSDLQGKRD